jgi:hypothetical protein
LIGFPEGSFRRGYFLTHKPLNAEI